MTALHSLAWAAWREAASGSRMHHGWILAGKQGLGKRAFADAAARELLGARPDLEHHPDIIVLTYGPKDEKEEKKREDGKDFELARSIRIAQIREVQQRLTTRPTLGEKRVVIIDPADDMERNASNALLKSLEEPPHGTIFLLVTHRPAQLLPTIRSRCRVLRFNPLEQDDLVRQLKVALPDTDGSALAEAVHFAGGSPGSARQFIEQDLGSLAKVMHAMLEEGDRTLGGRGELAARIGARPDRERIQAILALARNITADVAAEAEPAKRIALIEAHSELVALSRQAPTFNFDPGLLAMEIGTLLADAGAASERAHG
ncbi:AAA family ATPase [Altererythrobacter sp. GH1-8]|uniref:AAA family ATPase n=1 Tax=Altererythrobacter sp. GH1-8 TaxID=3349333 RepID=UPI00374DADD0